jgi:hypothetical protein
MAFDITLFLTTQTPGTMAAQGVPLGFDEI